MKVNIVSLKLGFLLLGVFYSCAGKIVEIKSLKNIGKYIKAKNPLIAFDVHDTLIRYKEDAIMHVCKSCRKHLDLPNFKLKWFDIVSPEPEALNHVKSVISRYPCIALTKNNNLKSYYKFYQFDRLGIDFSKTFPSIPFYQIKTDPPALYEKGMISVGKGNDKGVVLKMFLEQNHIKPDQIVFVDDNLNYIKQVEAVAKEMEIPFIGLHYTIIDKSNKLKKKQASKDLVLKSLRKQTA